ncbi:30S ribosomal protein S5 [Kallipyga gabonensis]|uniref:30S ribosomal protein S5 n=1 Tax=Kallipyga gabonensis TaxID=1686287 RepID=UPI0006B53C9A|nr:30S ribosomal protein S5 [Kallipyga gabonensis]
MAKQNRRQKSEFEDKVIYINRVSKTAKGGRTARFTALVAVGDGKGNVGIAMGKAAEVPEAIRKGADHARKKMVKLPIYGTTVPHEIVGQYGAGKVLIMPAKEGTGIIAGGPVRAVCEVAGITDIRAKSLGSANALSIVNALMDGFARMKTPEQVAKLRGKSVEELMS